MGTCEVCDKLGKELEDCVGCGKPACVDCRGDEGRGYWSHSGKKGYGCTQCIEAHEVYEGGSTAIASEFKAYVAARLVPKIEALEKRFVEDLDKVLETRLKQTRAESERLLKEGLTSASKLTEDTLERGRPVVKEVLQVVKGAENAVKQSNELVGRFGEVADKTVRAVERLAPKLEKLVGSAETKAEAGEQQMHVLERVDKLLDRVQPNLPRILDSFDRLMKDREEERRHSSATMFKNAVLVVGFGLFFYLAHLFGGGELTTYRMLRIGWGALSIPAALIMLPSVVGIVWRLRREVPVMTIAAIQANLAATKLGSHLFTLLMIGAVWLMFWLVERAGTIPL